MNMLHITQALKANTFLISNLGCYTKQFEERVCCTRQLSITVVALQIRIDFNEKGNCKR